MNYFLNVFTETITLLVQNEGRLTRRIIELCAAVSCITYTGCSESRKVAGERHGCCELVGVDSGAVRWQGQGSRVRTHTTPQSGSQGQRGRGAETPPNDQGFRGRRRRINGAARCRAERRRCESRWGQSYADELILIYIDHAALPSSISQSWSSFAFALLTLLYGRSFVSLSCLHPNSSSSAVCITVRRICSRRR